MTVHNNMPVNDSNREGDEIFKIRILYDNTSYKEGCKADWGFSCIINDSILFDTGKSFDILRGNLKFLKTSTEKISHIIISHNHNDHNGGLTGLLKQLEHKVKIYGPVDFINNLTIETNNSEAELRALDKTFHICQGAFALNPLPYSHKSPKSHEVSLVLVNGAKICIITGCAHPGVKAIVEAAKSEFPGKTIGLLMGGFHLANRQEPELSELSAFLKQSGVLKIAPMHCTSKSTIEFFRKVYGAGFSEGGTGREILF